jgi:hypothetical protein
LRDFPPESEQMPGGDKCICLLNISWIKGRFTYHNGYVKATINEPIANSQRCHARVRPVFLKGKTFFQSLIRSLFQYAIWCRSSGTPPFFTPGKAPRAARSGVFPGRERRRFPGRQARLSRAFFTEDGSEGFVFIHLNISVSVFAFPARKAPFTVGSLNGTIAHQSFRLDKNFGDVRLYAQSGRASRKYMASKVKRYQVHAAESPLDVRA